MDFELSAIGASVSRVITECGCSPLMAGKSVERHSRWFEMSRPKSGSTKSSFDSPSMQIAGRNRIENPASRDPKLFAVDFHVGALGTTERGPAGKRGVEVRALAIELDAARSTCGGGAVVR